MYILPFYFKMIHVCTSKIKYLGNNRRSPEKHFLAICNLEQIYDLYKQKKSLVEKSLAFFLTNFNSIYPRMFCVMLVLNIKHIFKTRLSFYIDINFS